MIFMNQDSVRRKFKQYLFDYKNPSMKLIAEEIGITLQFLTNWKNGKKNMSPETLKKVDRFIEKYNKIDHQ